jgi:drug/metabolite transporter (DMT)-like permease
MPWKTFWRRHVFLLRTTAQMIETQELVVPRGQRSPIPYFIKMIPFITSALTIAGGSWYVAVNMTSGSDLTAIYNCSAFFAYVFSVPLLEEKLRWDKSFAVIVAIIGVLVVAYGDAQPATHDSPNTSPPGRQSADEETEAKNRLWGNIIIGVGSVLYGLYEVLYKKLACPPEGTSPGRGMIFANAVGTLIGSFTFFILWIPLPILHYMGWETFELPRGEAAWMLFISVLGNVTFSGSFLILISLTSPVLSSVAALLTIFIVAIVEWLLTGKPLTPGAIVGGLLIIGAFGMLTWSTYKEMQADRRKKEVDLVESNDESDEEDP